MHPDAQRLRQRLAQIDDYAAKGLMRREEADAERASVKRRLLDLELPDAPAPGVGWRARLGALGAMATVVAVVTAWLLWGNAGLKPRAVAMLRAAAAPAPVTGHTALLDPGPTASAPGAPASAPHIDVHVELAPPLAHRVDPDDALFIEAHLPGDTGLPLAAVRKRAGDLPLDATLDAAQSVGGPERFESAPLVVLTARLSHSGRGRPEPGDLEGHTPPIPLGTPGVRILIGKN